MLCEVSDPLTSEKSQKTTIHKVDAINIFNTKGYICMFCVMIVVHDKKKSLKSIALDRAEVSTASNMLNIKASQTMPNHVVEEIHRCYTKVYTSSKISKKKIVA